MRRDLLHPSIQACLKRLPPPHNAHYGVVPPPPPSAIPLFETNRDCSEAVAAIATVDEQVRIAPHAFAATRLLMRKEAVSSSSIEGTQSTLDEILELDEHSNAPARPAARQVRSYSLTLERALQTVCASGKDGFSESLIRSMHRDLMASDPAYPDPPGEFRSCVVWIGSHADIAYSTYTPCPPADIQACVEQHVRFLRGDTMDQFLPLPIRMALAHVHIEAIHPFRDGNGRLGRLLLPLMMAAEGHQPLFLAPFIEAHRTDYYDALKDAQQRLNWVPIVHLICRSIVASVEDARLTYDALKRLPALWRARGNLSREGSAPRRALDLLPGWPVLTVNRLAELLRVSKQTANLAVQHLTRVGILEERTGYLRNRIFVAPEVLRVLNRPFGQAPLPSIPPAPSPV